MSHEKLLEEWNDLLKRRPTFREPLSVYRALLDSWAHPSGAEPRPLSWTTRECEERWQREVPLLSEAPLSISPADIEDRLEVSLEILRRFGGQEDALQRFAHAWDDGEISPAMLFPTKDRIGTARLEAVVAPSRYVVSFLACGALRPTLYAYFADCRSHLTDRRWVLGVCPFCGAPPGFADVAESGQRRLACHLCGGDWVFPRLRCPFCGQQTAKDLVRLEAEDKEEGYFISGCKQCHGYIKELDRRVRWNAGSALIEDWGSPHLDLVAVRAGYWRPIPSLIQLTEGRG